MLIVKAVHYTLNIEHRVRTNGFRLSWEEAIKRVSRLLKDDRDANFVEKDASGKTVNRWTTTGIMTASAMSNEAALLTQKWVRMLGIVPMCNQANT